MTTPEQERVFEANLRVAEAVRRVARERALIDFNPTDALNFPLYVAAITSADSTFRAAVIAAAAAANITLAPPGSSP
jgi:hypothetical protein